MVSFDAQKFLILVVQVSFFFFFLNLYYCAFGVLSKKSLPTPMFMKYLLLLLKVLW